MTIKEILFLIIVIISVTKSYGNNEHLAQSNEDTEDEPIYSNHKYFDDDSMGSIQKYEPGRVQIKVYRGPDIVGNDESYAAHGFWVKQPSEDY
ncbi:Hypothetical protein CINCED_3A002806 [Cinara cedri]|nr:Hypothetical protein CINCED_3A002806 [Cinara cedri]